MERGANVPNPSTIDIGDEVDLSRVSAAGLTLFPGCRVYGARTVISSGVTLGAEAPVTVDDCCLGPAVELKGGYFRRAVFLEKATMGSGAQVREGCLLEEEASGAQCVGLKQTILFPFVTLGSLINFCDCLMAGGTSRADHSEVGSSYIHFNFTPDGDKTTASLFGDVPRGVMLSQPPIFLGGQGGAVGPMRVEYGTVVAAGSILRRDILAQGKLVSSPPAAAFVRERVPHAYGNLTRVVRNNVVYLANLVALEEWYRKVRQPFFARQTLGEELYAGALEVLAAAKEERVSRLLAMAQKVPVTEAAGKELHDKVGELCDGFAAPPPANSEGERFLSAFGSVPAVAELGYVDAIKSLTQGLSSVGVQWLQQIVDTLAGRADALLPALGLHCGQH
jgi:UDP-N-acetylglucosamine/UDP-N-acetylgalactosamine diphosphorylase